jgi:thioester reductase-like protein
MSYFVTGATGFIGRHLVERLLEREGDIHVLVREGSEDKLDRLRAAAGDRADRIKPVKGDLSEPLLGVSEEDRAALKGVEHFFHLAAIYDMTADEERNKRLNVQGTTNAIELANELGAGASTTPPRSRSRACTRGTSPRTTSTSGRSSRTRTTGRSSRPRSSCARA